MDTAHDHGSADILEAILDSSKARRLLQADDTNVEFLAVNDKARYDALGVFVFSSLSSALIFFAMLTYELVVQASKRKAAAQPSPTS
jgi:hypothetical protein